ncbi:MAG: hypothetical protein JXA52_01180 [Planctomycetes bacterium]|nr:hypothetical protein [Planctomycetota bacterium]
MQKQTDSAFEYQPPTIWQKLLVWSYYIVSAGTVLGFIAKIILGREFTKEELGIFAWPVTILFLGSLFYIGNYLVFTQVKSRIRYFVIPCWLLIIILVIIVIVKTLFSH